MNKLLTAFLAGIAVGVLIAPDRGSETRRRLSEKTSDLKGSFNDLVDSAADNLKSAKNKVNEFVRKGEKTVEDLRNEKGTEQWTS